MGICRKYIIEGSGNHTISGWLREDIMEEGWVKLDFNRWIGKEGEHILKKEERKSRKEGDAFAKTEETEEKENNVG